MFKATGLENTAVQTVLACDLHSIKDGPLKVCMFRNDAGETDFLPVVVPAAIRWMTHSR